MVARCPADNTASLEQEQFWDGHWDAHKVGWLISGCAAAVTCVLSLITIIGHARNYNRPLEQRQIVRVLLLPPVYAVVSFLSYRFYRSYTYYEVSETIYEALAIAAFLMLMLQYIGDSVDEQRGVFTSKDKKPLPIPFCCWRYRPSKAYFLVLLKWSVIQYVLVRPALSIASIITEYYQVYCVSNLSYKYAYVYLLAIDFFSISVALYGLIVLYTLIKDDLQGRRPLAKFLTIKLVVFFVFYQSFVFDLLTDRGVIKATKYWTTTNVSDGLSALCVSLEMVLVAALQMWAFHWGEYRIDRVSKPTGRANKKGKTPVFFSLVHALNFSDFAIELWHELRFLFDRIRGKEYTRADTRYGKFDFVGAFNAGEEGSSEGGKGGNEMEMRVGQEKEFEANETAQSRRALLPAGTPPAQAGGVQDQDIILSPTTLDVPATASNGRISPKPKSTRESTGRYPSFLYEDRPSSALSVRQAPHAMNPRQPSPVDESSWASPGSYTVRGFPRNSVLYADSPDSSPYLGHPRALLNQSSQSQEVELQQPPLQVRDIRHDGLEPREGGPRGPEKPEERPRSWEPQAL